MMNHLKLLLQIAWDKLSILTIPRRFMFMNHTNCEFNICIDKVFDIYLRNLRNFDHRCYFEFIWIVLGQQQKSQAAAYDT